MTAAGVVMIRDQVLQLRASAEQRQMIDQAAAAEGISRTEFTLRCRQGSGQHRASARDAAALACALLSLSAGAILLAEVPGALRRNMADALRRSLAARRLVGARALLVHAIDEQAAAFYRSLGFRPSPISASTLMLHLSEPAG